MTHNLRLAAIITLASSLFACGEQVSFEINKAGIESEFSSLDNNACVGFNSKAINPANLKISGKSLASKGQRLSFKLDREGSCIEGQDIAWKTVSSRRMEEQNKVFAPVFSKAGTYTVSALVSTEASDEPTLVSHKTTVVGSEPMISGPEVAMSNSYVDFELALPQGHSFVSASWNFDDGSAAKSGLSVVSHVFDNAGIYNLRVAVVDSEGLTKNITHRLNIVPFNDNATCVGDLSMSVPTEIVTGSPTQYSVFIPQCLQEEITSVKWNFGVGGNTPGSQTVEYTYNESGSYTITVELYTQGSTEPYVSLQRNVSVAEAPPGTEPEENVEFNPTILACKRPGATRSYQSEIYAKYESCELEGIKQNSYRDRIVQECVSGEDGVLRWTEISKMEELLSEGVCESRSCQLPNGELLSHGESTTLYLTSNPEGTCESVKETRTCTDSVLSGSSSATQMSCTEGCVGFGSHGTKLLDVVTGTIKEAIQCGFGEEGIESTYQEISDKACNQGQVVTSNVRRGSVITEGQCPTYEWKPTEQYTACSANCGGEQSLIYQCVSNSGAVVDAARCVVAAPVNTRICDANPEAVRRSESTEQTESERSYRCPKDTIGSIDKNRVITTTKNYACINHKVQLENTEVVATEWVEENHCRNFVAHRCSGDSLGKKDTRGRLAWMNKCKGKLPAIAEYLEQMEGVSYGNGHREMYPTFMDAGHSPEKQWIAPETESAPCEMPAKAYVAAVCVASCSTPEQQVLVGDKKDLGYTSFIEALTNQEPRVATLPRASTMRTKRVKSTAVEQWVTELVDADHDILSFTMKSGRNLRVTTNHPLVTAEGRMKLAEEFKVGESLVELGGNEDEIVSIDAENYFGKVYNVFVKSSDPRQNIILINGYLNGTAFYQNEGAKHMNRQIFRSNLTRGVFK